MSLTAAHTHTTKVGTCPHGLPLGACPICDGMAGGNSTTKRDIPRNVGEMSYNQCAAIGAMLRAQKKCQTSSSNCPAKSFAGYCGFPEKYCKYTPKTYDSCGFYF